MTHEKEGSAEISPCGITDYEILLQTWLLAAVVHFGSIVVAWKLSFLSSYLAYIFSRKMTDSSSSSIITEVSETIRILGL